MFPCHQSMWLISPGVVLHKKLQDFTVGHAYLLEALESPFIAGGEVGVDDLVVAVLVCSMPFTKARKYLMQPPLLIARRATWWGWWCRLRGLDVDASVEAFKDYVSAYTDMPEAWVDKSKQSKSSAVPFTIRLAWAMMAKMDEAQAWDCPMARALGYYSAEAEYNGTEFVSEHQLKIIEA